MKGTARSDANQTRRLRARDTCGTKEIPRRSMTMDMQAGAEQYSCCTSGTYFVSFGTTGLSTSCRLDENHDIVKPAPLSLQILLASRVGETSARVIEVLITTVVTEQVQYSCFVTFSKRFSFR